MKLIKGMLDRVKDWSYLLHTETVCGNKLPRAYYYMVKYQELV